MIIRKPISLAAALAMIAVSAARADDTGKARAQMMIDTRLVAVADLAVPADQYVSDGDPGSLELVFLSKPEDGKSRVSADGEVIFLDASTSERKQTKLIEKAFDIRWASRQPKD